MAYKIKEHLTREQIEDAIHALNQFYGFGAVLSTAQEPAGYAWTTLYNGDETPTHADDFSDEQDLSNLSDDGCIVGVSGSWKGVAATYCGPVLQAKHFFAARDAFLACVEESD